MVDDTDNPGNVDKPATRSHQVPVFIALNVDIGQKMEN
jgi:hypothetical protein